MNSLSNLDDVVGDHFDKIYFKFLKDRELLKNKKWILLDDNLKLYEKRKKKHLQYMDKFRYRKQVKEEIIDNKKIKK